MIGSCDAVVPAGPMSMHGKAPQSQGRQKSAGTVWPKIGKSYVVPRPDLMEGKGEEKESHATTSCFPFPIDYFPYDTHSLHHIVSSRPSFYHFCIDVLPFLSPFLSEPQTRFPSSSLSAVHHLSPRSLSLGLPDVHSFQHGRPCATRCQSCDDPDRS